MKEILGTKVVDDVEEAVAALKKGEYVARFEYGNSMLPMFKSGEYALLVPVNATEGIKQGDAVFCKIGEHYLTHLVWMVSNGYYLIGSSRGELNGWTNEVYAIAHKTNIIEPEEEEEEEESI